MRDPQSIFDALKAAKTKEEKKQVLDSLTPEEKSSFLTFLKGVGHVAEVVALIIPYLGFLGIYNLIRFLKGESPQNPFAE